MFLIIHIYKNNKVVSVTIVMETHPKKLFRNNSIAIKVLQLLQFWLKKKVEIEGWDFAKIKL